MSCRTRATIGVALLGLAVAPGAEAAPKKLALARLGALPASVQQGSQIRVTGRVANLPKRRTRSARLTFSLRPAAGGARARHLRGVTLRRSAKSRGRRFSLRLRVPAGTRPGAYRLRACVTRGKASCRARALRVTARPTAGAPGTTPPGGGSPGPAPSGPGGPGGPGDGTHSLRAPVTGENFYFVMADRFENGASANDRGGLGDDPQVSGYQPTHKGYYHGGDLKGLLDRIDYIHDLGTTAIWLTPSFKNKAVQPEDNSAGYHGYWITDFTQIDPHLGTNAELKALVDAAHARGMKLYFDIITNHTADVIKYTEAARPGYISKDARPYTTAVTRTPFDDRDYAASSSFPALDPATSFPYHPFNPVGEETRKVPAWLNDVRLYHNRGNTTFVGENSLYGDFFGLDDLFTEHPQVVQGMTDIYQDWIADFGIDGFRIDTMKHVNDEFWRQFAPDVLAFARAHGKDEFFLFGEVFDTTKTFTSHFTTQAEVQAVLDFPFQEAARNFASRGNATDSLRDFFTADDWYTDADSNAYQLPTFLGNHDMGRMGHFIRTDNSGAGDPEVLARDRLAHELMYFSRGNPVIYYGDEQGFVGDGGDQDARQDMFPSQVATYNDDDLIGTDATTAQSNFDRSHPLYRSIAGLADVTEDHPALRDGAQQHRYSSDGAGIYAFSRLDRTEQREYVVALNNSEQDQTALVPTYVTAGGFKRVYGPGARRLRSDGAKRLRVAVPALSAVVYASDGRIPRSGSAPAITLTQPASGRDRLELRAGVEGASFYEVTFEVRDRDGDWQTVGTDDNAPYRVFPDVADVAPGTQLSYRAVVLDNAGHTRRSQTRSVTVAPPAIALDAPSDDARVRPPVEVRAVVTPERADYEVTFQRRVGDGDWTDIGTDSSSPAYSVIDEADGLASGTTVHYRAVLTYAPGRTVTSAQRTVELVPDLTTTVHYHRPAGDYADWGLHLWGDAIAPGVETVWAAPRQRDGVDEDGAYFEIPLKDDSKPVNFIVHRPNQGGDPSVQEPGGDRSFVPHEHPEIWLEQGDPAVYFSPPSG